MIIDLGRREKRKKSREAANPSMTLSREIGQGRSPQEIPRPARSNVNPRLIPIPINTVAEEIIASSRINQSEVGVQDAPPPAVHISLAVGEEAVPFFSDEATGS